MQVNPYLSFSGNCEEAFKTYERVLGGKIEMLMTHEGSPMAGQTPPEWGKKIMHASMTVNDQRVMGSDMPPGQFEKAAGFSLSIGLKDVAEAEKIFNELSDGGSVQMPLQETFWAKRFGMLVDRFGIPWMMNCE